MRIVNRWGTVDLPYEKIVILHGKALDSHYVKASDSFGYITNSIILGEYESKERCLEVMENIRTAYMHDKKVFLMPEE